MLTDDSGLEIDILKNGRDKELEREKRKRAFG